MQSRDQFLPRAGVVDELSAEIGEGEGGELESGQLLSAYPPFADEEFADGVSLRAVPAPDRIGFLADFARQVTAGSNSADRREV